MRVLAVASTLAIALSGLPAHAQIYKTRDEQGNVVYTDRPVAADSETVEVGPTNTAPPPPAAVQTPDAQAAPKAAAAAPSVEITAPANETTIPMGGGIFDVAVSVTGQREGQLLQLLMDGSPWGDPQPGATWQLANVFRGAHDLQVNLLDASGEVVASSPSVRVYVMRPSVLN